MFSKLGELPAKLANELRKYFAYALDPNSSDFSPILSAATILNPGLCSLLPPNLFNEGKNEIKKWFKRVPSQSTTVSTPIVTNNPFGRLAAQRNSLATDPKISWQT